MILLLFDCGGTLVNDPFPSTMRELANYSLNDPDLSERLVWKSFLEYWKDENATFNFPLASHFLQEELWIIRALGRLANERAPTRQSKFSFAISFVSSEVHHRIARSRGSHFAAASFTRSK
jgi:hypothetical protein